MVSVIWYFIILPRALSRPLLNAGFEAGKSETPNRQQTECPLTYRLSYRGSSKNLNSTSRPFDEWAFSPLDFTADWLSHLALATWLLLLILMLWHRLEIFESKGDKLSSSAAKLWLKTWHDRGYTGQLSARLECTGVNFNTRVLILNCIAI